MRGRVPQGIGRERRAISGRRGERRPERKKTAASRRGDECRSRGAPLRIWVLAFCQSKGSPSARKTFTGARMICELVRRCKKVGITPTVIRSFAT